MTQYTDLRLRYLQQPGPVLVHDIGAINESIDQIIETMRGSRFFNRGFGSDLMRIIFEQMTSITEFRLINHLILAISSYEPRVRLVKSQSYARANYDENFYEVRVAYVINLTQQVGVYTTTLSRDEVR